MEPRASSTLRLALVVCVLALGLGWLLSPDSKVSKAEDFSGDAAPPVTREEPEVLEAPPALVEIPEISPTELRSALDEVAPKAEIHQESVAGKRFLRGRVVEPGGRSVEGALVALMETRDGKPVSSVRNVTVKTNPKGEFEMEVPGWAPEARILVSARKDGWRPFSSIESINAAYLDVEQELPLGIGFTIQGRVVRDGAPVAGARVGLDVASGISGVHGAGPESWWANGRLEEKHGSVETAEDGTFELSGLSPAEHRVSISERDAPKHRISSHLFAVTAPDSRTYDLSSAILQISVQGQTGPLEGAKVKVSAKSGRVKFESGPTPKGVEVPALSSIAVSYTHLTLPTTPYV